MKLSDLMVEGREHQISEAPELEWWGIPNIPVHIAFILFPSSFRNLPV